MTAVLASLFTTAMELSGRQRFFLMLPLCLSIAIVYKAIRNDSMQRFPIGVLTLWVTIVMGLVAVGGGLWMLFRIMV